MKQPLRIGINALYLIPERVGGTEIYLRGLLAALTEIDSYNHYIVFTAREATGDLVPSAANFRACVQPVPAVFRPARLLWEQSALPLAAVRERLDVLFNPGFTAPLFCPCPQVTVFHDLQHKRHPEFFRWFDLPFWRFFLYWSAHVSRSLVAVSNTTAADLYRYYRIPPSRLHVAPLGVDQEFFEIGRRRARGAPCPEPFLLTASTLHPHKNLDRLLHAFAEFRRRRPDFRLVVTGIHGFHSAPLHALRASLGLDTAVDFPGWIPRDQLHDLYARAWAFVYPSRFEGFGLPVLEALAAAVPTACSAIEPLSGIAGEAALQFDPHDPAAILQALVRIVEDQPLRDRLVHAGPRRASEFSWTLTAQKTLAVLLAAAQPK